MPILFDDTRVSTRSPGRSTRGLWLSVGFHAIVVPLIAITLGMPGKPPTPRQRPLTVFIAPVTLPSAPVVTPRLPDDRRLRGGHDGAFGVGDAERADARQGGAGGQKDG